MKSYNDKKSGRYIIFRMLASEKKFFEYDNMVSGIIYYNEHRFNIQKEVINGKENRYTKYPAVYYCIGYQ